MRTLSTVAAAVGIILCVGLAALAFRAGSMKPTDLAEEWKVFKRRTIEPLTNQGAFRSWEPTQEELFDEEGFLREPNQAASSAS
jgi:hypothetical protein